MTNVLDRSATARWKYELGNLLRRGADHDDRDFTQWADDPKGFIKDVLRDDKLYDLQEEVIEAVRTNPLVSVKGAHAMGKDHVAAALAFWFVLCKPGRTKVLITGPTQHQVQEILFGDELNRAHARGRLPGALYSSSIRFPGKPRRLILGRVSTEVARLTGHHAPYVFCIITEAQGTDEVAFTAALGNATGPNDRILLVGNPTEPTGPFFATHQANSAWCKITMPATRHPNVISGTQIIPGGPSREALDRQRREWGENSVEWRTRVLAEFPTSATDALLHEEWLAEAVARWNQWDQRRRGAVRDATRSAALYVGIDVARFGGDFNVVIAIRGGVVIGIEAWVGMSTVETEQMITNVFRKLGMAPGGNYGAARIDEGAAGGGAGVLDHLVVDGWDISGFNGTKRPENDPEQYANLRSWGYWGLRKAFQTGAIAIPPDQMLLEELRAITYTYNHKNQILIAKKSDLKAALHRSPDRADALMMGWSLSLGDEGSMGGANGNFGF